MNTLPNCFINPKRILSTSFSDLVDVYEYFYILNRDYLYPLTCRLIELIEKDDKNAKLLKPLIDKIYLANNQLIWTIFKLPEP